MSEKSTEPSPAGDVPQEEMVVPYCGGCGHLYFSEPKIPLSKAQERAKTDRCHYCIEDEIEDKKRANRPKPPPPVEYYFDEWGGGYGD